MLEVNAVSKAPHRELQILGVILAALDRNTRYLVQRLRHVDTGSSKPDRGVRV